MTNRFSIQFNVTNVTDQAYAGSTGLYTGAYIDQIGRRFQLSVRTKF